MTFPGRISLEAADSWDNYLQQHQRNENSDPPSRSQQKHVLRQLKKKQKEAEEDGNLKKESDEDLLASQPTESSINTDTSSSYLYQSLKERKKREKALNEMYRNPGIQDSTTHGMMVCITSIGIFFSYECHVEFNSSRHALCIFHCTCID